MFGIDCVERARSINRRYISRKVESYNSIHNQSINQSIELYKFFFYYHHHYYYSFIYDFKAKDKGGKVGNGSVRKSVPKEIADALGDAHSTGSSEDRNNVQHKNDASCGELMASYTYLLKNSGQSLKNKKPKRTIAWLYTKTKDGKIVEQAHDSCGTNENAWGCDLFCKKMDFTPVDTKTEKACDLPKIAKSEQQPLMTQELRS